MSNKPIRVRTRLVNSVTTVKALISHPMETGLRKDKKTGEQLPAHYIQEVTCRHNGALKISLELGISVSRNPFLQFELEGGAKGDLLELAWKDNRGETDAVTVPIK
jgi:sulfur-oxidizing protein SoxZ